MDSSKIALELHRQGFSVIPVKLDGTKSPSINWGAYQAELPTAEETEYWFRNGAGVALVCGAVSGNLEVVDFDDAESFAPFCEELERRRPGILSKLTIVKTPRPGYHVYFRCETIEANQKLAMAPAVDERGKPTTKVLIETRGQGGYVLTVGSPPAAHPTGKIYTHHSGPPVGECPRIEPEERADILAAARSLNRVIEERRIDSGKNLTIESDGLRPGDAIESKPWPEILGPHGWEIDRVAGDVTHMRRPGKAAGSSATTGLRSKNGKELFCVFSSNASPFEAGECYSKFGAYATLNHRGDFSEAARALGGPAIIAANVAATDDSPLPEGNPWPEPLGEEAFHGLLGKIVRTIEPHSEADVAALLIQSLLAIGCLIGRSAYFCAEADRHFGNLFAVLVGRTSKGRKGTSWGHVEKLLRVVDSAFVTDRVQGGLSSGEGLIWAVRDPIYRLEAIKEKGQTVGTQTVLADAGIDDKRLLAMESEFASVLAVAGRERNTVSAILRQAWDGKKLQTMTKNSPATATDSHIAIVGHITAEELRKQFAAVDMVNGLANRFLWVCVARSKELPQGSFLADEELEKFVAPLKLVVDHATGREDSEAEGDLADFVFAPPEPWAIARDEAANRLWCEVYGPLSEGRPGLLGAALGRAEPLVMRLAMIYALLDLANAIGEVHLRAALAVWRYCEDSAKFIFGDSMGSAVADTILAELRRRKPEGMTRTEISNLLNRHCKPPETAAALTALREQNLVRSEVDQTTGGRPRELWFSV